MKVICINCIKILCIITEEQCDVACGPEHFTCSNNCCISEDLECDGEAQCSDGSDETQCSNCEKTYSSHIKNLKNVYVLNRPKFNLILYIIIIIYYKYYNKVCI